MLTLLVSTTKINTPRKELKTPTMTEATTVAQLTLWLSTPSPRMGVMASMSNFSEGMYKPPVESARYWYSGTWVRTSRSLPALLLEL